MAEAHALSRKQQREAEQKLVAELEVQKKELEDEIERVWTTHTHTHTHTFVCWPGQPSVSVPHCEPENSPPPTSPFAARSNSDCVVTPSPCAE
jgi:hypothetical protein